MRKSGCLTAFFSLVAVALLTGLCSLTSFGLAQRFVIDASAAGLQVEDPLALLRCAAAGQCQSAAPAAVLNAPLLVLTPLRSAAPTASPAAAAAPIAGPTAPALRDLPRITDPRELNILLLGIDQRSAAEERGPFRSDTMILININPARQTIGVLSLPRDLWVNIPGYQPGRINTANFIGDRDAYPNGGGPALALETIAENFGLRADKYLLVNFDVFTRLVDILAPNGVLINVPEYIDDPHYPGERYDTIHVTFEPGEQRLDAERLLQYARTRATEGGDFDRARRQQAVLDALRAEVLSAGGIANFIAQAPLLWQELQGNYRTNLEFSDILALGRLLGEIEREDIRYRVVNNLYTNLGQSPQGEQVLYPDTTAIRDLILNTFYPQAQLTLAEIKARADAEAAAIHVYNGTNLPGLASKTKEWLLAKGVRVARIDNDITTTRKLTEIRDYGRHSWTTQYLARLLGLADDRITRSGDGMLADAVLLALGEDALAIIEG